MVVSLEGSQVAVDGKVTARDKKTKLGAISVGLDKVATDPKAQPDLARAAQWYERGALGRKNWSTDKPVKVRRDTDSQHDHGEW